MLIAMKVSDLSPPLRYSDANQDDRHFAPNGARAVSR